MRRGLRPLLATVAIVGLGAGAGPALASGEKVSFTGGDLVTLARPKALTSGAVVGKAWKTIRVTAKAGLPEAGVGSVFVRVTAALPRGGGQIVGRPLGFGSAGVRLLSFSAPSTQSLALLPVGRDGAIQVRSSAGSPKVSMALVSWVPKTASLVVPAEPQGSFAAKVGSTTRTVKLGGVGLVPSELTSAVVSVETTAKKSGRLALWTAGSKAPRVGESFPAGHQSLLRVVRLSSAGKLSLRTLSRSATVSLRVLAWGLPTTTLEAAKTPAVLGSVKSGTSSALAVAGTKGVPGASQDVAMTISAPKGMKVDVWPGATAAGAAAASFTSRGGASSVLVRVPSGRKVRVRARGAGGAAQVLASGWVSKLGHQEVSFTPKENTSTVGPGDVVSLVGNAAVLRPTVDELAYGDHVMIRPPDAPAAFVARVTEASRLPNGNQKVTLEDVPLADAFVDYKASFTGPLTQPFSPKTEGRALEGGSQQGLLPDWLKITPEGWSCSLPDVSTSSPVDVDLYWSGNVNADIDIASATVDVSVKGGVQIVAGLDSPVGLDSLSCSASADLPTGQIPLGSTGLTAKFGTEAELTAFFPDSSAGAKLTLTGSARAYAAVFYSAGEVVTDGAVGFSGSADPRANHAEIELQVGVGVSVGPPYLFAGEGPGAGRWWEATLTMGHEFRFGPPHPEDDPYERVLMGPRCLDGAVGPYIEVGAGLILPFLPDVAIEAEPFEIPKWVFYKGPCWGYSGTISYEYEHAYAQGERGCTAQTCPGASWTKAWKKTLIPGPASFTRFSSPIYGAYGSPVLQPYSWSYSKQATIVDDVPTTHDGSSSVHCQWDYEASGDGSMSWFDGPEDEARSHQYDTFVFDGWEPGSTSMASSGVPWATVSETMTPTGDPSWCGAGTTSDTAVENVEAYSEVANLTNYNKKTIDTTLTGHVPYHPEDSWSATLNLTRNEYPRE